MLDELFRPANIGDGGLDLRERVAKRRFRPFSEIERNFVYLP